MRCLTEYMHTPPFEKFCSRCGERVHHPKFPSDAKSLERIAKSWSMEQARQREIQEVIDFFDL